MAKRAKAKTVEVKSSHVAYMSHPKEDSQAHRRGCHLRQCPSMDSHTSDKMISADPVRVGGDSVWT
jgi:hypothetical protein